MKVVRHLAQCDHGEMLHLTLELPREEQPYKDDADLKPLIDALISELQTAKDNQPAPTPKVAKTK